MTQTETQQTGRTGSTAPQFTPEERAAMKARAAELKAAAKRGARSAEAEADALAKIAAMDEPDRGMAEALHALVKDRFPELSALTWYGMPAYAKDGRTLFFFKPGGKFKMRYSTLGFSDKAGLDDGDMWPSEFALLRWSDAVEARIIELVRDAVG